MNTSELFIIKRLNFNISRLNTLLSLWQKV